MDTDNWDGAGAMPYCVHEGKVYFLLQETKGGKKEGKLVDFGGGRNKEVDSDILVCGAREFSEETAGLFTTSTLSQDVEEMASLDRHTIEQSPIVKKETERCLALFKEAQAKQYVVTTDLNHPSWYASFAIRISHSDLHLQNAFFADPAKHKVRVFQWVIADAFISLLDHKSDVNSFPLHRRIFALKNVKKLVQRINSEESTP
jgi:hypothetical protein